MFSYFFEKIKQVYKFAASCKLIFYLGEKLLLSFQNIEFIEIISENFVSFQSVRIYFEFFFRSLIYMVE